MFSVLIPIDVISTCKLGHFWLKVKFSQVLSCLNSIIIQVHAFLKVAPVIVDASIVQLRCPIMSLVSSIHLSVNSMCTLQGCVVIEHFSTHNIAEDWQQKPVQANPNYNPPLLVVSKIK